MSNRATGRWLLASSGLAAVGLGAMLFRPAPAAAPTRTESVNAPADAGFAAWRGVNSCTSSACHNQDPGRGDRAGAFARGSEYAVWFARDPHAHAYQALFDDKSVRIQERLHTSDPEKQPLKPTWNRLCLRCHVAPEAETITDAAPVWFSDGVGCESCHGGAAGWLAAHVGPGWRQTSSAEKKGLGFQDTKDLAVRAKRCMDCHVGGNRAEVNHDLYAAGHPPLQFEFSSALDRYRPYQHWSEADDRRRNPAYEAEAWAVGQAESTRAALKLLASRAEGQEREPAERPPWPEFSEYVCSSCHHALEQRRPVSPNHKPGATPWSWYVAMTPLLPESLPAHQPDALVKELRDEMETRNPNPARVSVGARALAQVYDDWLNRHPAGARLDADALRGRLILLSGPEGEAVVRRGWEDARQLSFAVSAHYRSLEAIEPDARTAAAVRRVTQDLCLPPGLDTPDQFDPAMVSDDLHALRNLLDSHK